MRDLHDPGTIDLAERPDLPRTRPRALGAYVFAGGFTLGVQEHFDVACHLEGDGGYGVSTAKLNWPDMPVHYGPAKWPVDELAKHEWDLIYANPPCAIFSSCGRSVVQSRDWRDDPRVACWRESFSLLEKLRPTTFALESVSEAYTRGRELVDELTKHALMGGYSVTHLLENAQWFGVPQKRKRFMFIAHRAAAMAPLGLNYAPPPTVREVLETVGDDKGDEGRMSDDLRTLLIHVLPGMSVRRVWLEHLPEQSRGRPMFIEYRLPQDRPMGAFVGDFYYHPAEPRKLGVREMLAVCGFPTDFKLPAKTSVAARGALIARGVLPPVARGLAAALAATATMPAAAWAARRVTLVDAREPGVASRDITAEYLDAGGRVRFRLRAPTTAAAPEGQSPEEQSPEEQTTAPAPVAPPRPRAATPRPASTVDVVHVGATPDAGEGSGRFIQRLWQTTEMTPDEIVAAVHANYANRTTKRGDVYFGYRKLLDAGATVRPWSLSAGAARQPRAAAPVAPTSTSDNEPQPPASTAESSKKPTAPAIATGVVEPHWFAVDAAAPPEERFWAFARERHRVALARAAGESAPWTRDVVLRRFRFTNIFRDLDAVTAWLIREWYEPHRDDPDVWFACCLARFVNRVSTLAELGYPGDEWTPDGFSSRMSARRARGTAAFGSAYTTVSEGAYAAIKGTPEPQIYMTSSILDVAWQRGREHWRHDPPRTMHAAANWIKEMKWWGEFLSYQVVLDLLHTDVLAGAEDHDSYVQLGPGSRNGLAIVRGDLKFVAGDSHGKVSSRFASRGSTADIAALHACATNWWPVEWRQLMPRDIEQALCEFYKYELLRTRLDSKKDLYVEGYASTRNKEDER